MADYQEKLVIHAAAIFATIEAGKDPGPVDPFLAGLMEEAIRERAGLTNGVQAHPASAVPATVSRMARPVFEAVAAVPDGLLPREVADRTGLSRVNAQYHLLALARRKILRRSETGCYSVGELPAVVRLESADAGTMRAELQRRGLTHPGGLNIKVAEYAKAAGRDVTSREIGKHLKATTTSTTAKAMAPLLKIGALTKVSIGVYRWVDG